MEKVMIITGTRKGIGRELCGHYLAEGFVVAGCSRGEATCEHPSYDHYRLDVSDEKAVANMVRDVYKKYKRLDILINNAGAASMNHVTLTPLQTAKNIFDTNYFGTFLFVREAAKIMMKHKFGRIVNFSTVAVPLGLEGEAIYASSKAAIVMLTHIAAKELAAFGITVNAVGPTPVDTDLIKAVPKEKINALLARQAIKRFGDFRDIVNVINFFIEEQSDFITGQVIYLGGVNG